MVQYRDIILKRQAREARKQDRQSFRRAVLTDEFGNQTSANPLDDVWAVEDDRKVWYMTDGATQPAQILCRKISDPYVGLGVIIGYADGSNQLEVLSDDFFLTGTGDPTSWASTAPRDFEPGGRKQMWVYSKVITPLATYPGSGISVNVISGDYPYLGTRKTYAGSVNFPLTSNPNAGEHYLAGLYLDASNALQVVYGASVVVATTPPEPSWPAGAFRLSAVRVNDTQTSISFADDVFDRRMAWSDEQAGTTGWPFTNILTVSTTDAEADYANLTDAIAAADAGDGILLDIESSSETVTVDKVVYIIGLAKGGTVFTNSMTISAAATLVNIKVSIASGTNSKGFIISDSANLITCEAVTSGTSTSRAIEVTAGNPKVFGGYYESGGAGTSIEVFVSGGSCSLIDPILSGGDYSGTVLGTYRDLNGNTIIINELRFMAGASMTDTVWLVDTSGGVRTKYDDLPTAAAAAAAGDVILLGPGTYTLTSQIAYGAAFTIQGSGPERTTINCATNSVALLLLDTAGAALRDLTITHSGAGVLNSGVYITANATVENVIVTLSGAATANYPILQQGGTATLTNVTATASGATTNHAYRNDTADATVTISGGTYSGTQVDIYGERAGSIITLNDPALTNATYSWSGTIRGEARDSYGRRLRIKPARIRGGRLTLTSGTAVTTSDVTGATTVYFTPGIAGSEIEVFNGYFWVEIPFAEVSAAVPSTVYRMFDVFAYDNAGALAIETLNWSQAGAAITGATNATPIVITSNGHPLANGDVVFITGVGGNTAANGVWTVSGVAANTFNLNSSAGSGAYTSGGTWVRLNETRATALAVQNGVYVKNGATTRTYLGTGMTTATSGETADSSTARLLWNYFNRLPRPVSVTSGTSHTYTTAAFRPWNNDKAIRVEFVKGVDEESIFIQLMETWNFDSGDTASRVNVGLNSTSAAGATTTELAIGDVFDGKEMAAAFFSSPTTGYAYFQAIELGGATSPDFVRVIINGYING